MTLRLWENFSVLRFKAPLAPNPVITKLYFFGSVIELFNFKKAHYSCFPVDVTASILFRKYSFSRKHIKFLKCFAYYVSWRLNLCIHRYKHISILTSIHLHKHERSLTTKNCHSLLFQNQPFSVWSHWLQLQRNRKISLWRCVTVPQGHSVCFCKTSEEVLQDQLE